MRKSHFELFTVAAVTAAFCVMAPAAMSQDIDPGQSPIEQVAPQEEPTALTAEQKAEMATWSEEQQQAYTTWPANVQSFYWTLPKGRQMLFWRLENQDKLALTTMNDADREVAWQELEQQALEMKESE